MNIDTSNVSPMAIKITHSDTLFIIIYRQMPAGGSFLFFLLIVAWSISSLFLHVSFILKKEFSFFLFFSILILIDRCTLANNCPLNLWQQEGNQCTHIVNVQPLKASIDNSQWVCHFIIAFYFSFIIKFSFVFSKD